MVVTHNSHTTVVSVGTSCLTGQYCSMQELVVGKTIDIFSPGSSQSTFQLHES